MNTDKILGRMREKHITQGGLQELLCEKGVSLGKTALNQKLQGKADFRVSELTALLDILELKASDVFTGEQ